MIQQKLNTLNKFNTVESPRRIPVYRGPGNAYSFQAPKSAKTITVCVQFGAHQMCM